MSSSRTAAISAIDIALHDIAGKALGVPVYELFGGRARDKVVCYPHNRGHATEVEPLVESCLQTKEEGWKFVRWGLAQTGDVLEPRQAVRTAIRQFQAVREALGDEIRTAQQAVLKYRLLGRGANIWNVTLANLQQASDLPATLQAL